MIRNLLQNVKLGCFSHLGLISVAELSKSILEVLFPPYIVFGYDSHAKFWDVKFIYGQIVVEFGVLNYYYFL